ncbi:YfhO family protein [Marinomonas primoryensis]|jgi:hypothetical protein|uniref:YfhO family protein n=1 Tax=Marinomonas primoryensis TaxID=178399 RepID=UPI0037048DBB
MYRSINNNIGFIDRTIGGFLESRYSFLTVIFLTLFLTKWMIFKYTGWDTHDVFFTEFILFADSINSGFFPIINNFIQSGSFIPVGSKNFLYTIYAFPFLMLSKFINPIYAFELFISFLFLVSASGMYLYIDKLGSGKKVAILISVVYMLSLPMPISGQLGYVYSWAVAPWLLYFYHLTAEKERISFLSAILLGLALGLFIVGAGPWHLLVIYSFSAVYSLVIKGKIFKPNVQFFLILILSFFIYFIINFEGFKDVYFSYFWVGSDYASPEPRLRSFYEQPPRLVLQSLYASFLNLIDINFLRAAGFSSSSWYNGLGYLAALYFVFSIYFYRSQEKYIYINIFLIVLVAFFLAYSSSPYLGIYEYYNMIPVFSLHRWLGEGVGFSIYFIMVFWAIRFSGGLIKEVNLASLSSWIFILIMLFIPLYFNGMKITFSFSLFLIPVIIFLRLKNFNIIFLLLLAFYVYFFTLTHPVSSMTKNIDFVNSVAERNKTVEIKENSRIQFDSNVYEFYVPQNFLEKKLTTHGYNIVGDPFFWYVKNHDLTKTVVSFFNCSRYSSLSLDASSKGASNDFIVHAVREIEDEYPVLMVYDKNDVRVADECYVDSDAVDDFVMTPSSIKFNYNSVEPGILLISTPYRDGWHAVVNGNAQPIIKTSGRMLGIKVNSQGLHNVEITYTNYFFVSIIFIFNIIFITLTLYLSILKIYIKN